MSFLSNHLADCQAKSFAFSGKSEVKKLDSQDRLRKRGIFGRKPSVSQHPQGKGKEEVQKKEIVALEKVYLQCLRVPKQVQF